MFRSATFKLTLYYLLIIAVICIGFSSILYRLAESDLAFGLQRQTERISTNFPVFSNSPYLHMDDELKAGRNYLIVRLIILNGGVLVLAGFASYALARRTLQPIEAAHERQKRFTAHVSHELRTPLTALKMESEVALLDAAASKQQLRQVIGSNVEEAEKLTQLIANLLKLSQLDASQTSKLLVPVSLAEIVSAAIAQIGAVAQQRHITIRQSTSADSFVKAEPGTLKQLFVILLDNAVKYSPPQSTITVTVTATRTAEVTISDAGNGIAKADLEHVFERFYRADSAQADGYGLGLSIATLIADNHAATISLTSQPGKGTTARVLMPTVDQPPTASPSPASPAAKP